MMLKATWYPIRRQEPDLVPCSFMISSIFTSFYIIYRIYLQNICYLQICL